MNLELKQEDFAAKVLGEQEKPVVLEVWTAACGVCRRFNPLYRELAEEMAGEARFYQLKADDNPQLARSLGIFGVPTLLYYRHGILIRKRMGAQSRQAIKKTLFRLQAFSPEESRARQYRSLWQRLTGKK